MFSHNFYVFTYVCLFLYITQSCISEPLYPPQLVLYSAGEPEYTDVLVKRVGDNLTLVCELRDDLTSLTSYVWNYIPDNDTAVRPYTVSPSSGPSTSSQLYKPDLQVSDSGQYFCSAPPFSVTKYILVQTRGPLQCARGAFWCGARCVLPSYVCDGFVDCLHGEDESVQLCSTQVCSRSDKLNCSSGRCISAAACCRRAAPLCRQPACCDEYPRHAPLEGYVDVEFPKQFDDRHAPDDYGFIQSTIYTVTACALIFMLAVVLLVSAICKMHMKRAALRQYTQPDLYHRHQTARFPPCYEASRLLEGSAPAGPVPEPPPPPPPRPPRGLARLARIFNNRYRQVPTVPPEVEMTSYHPSSLQTSPSREYRSPTYLSADLSADLRTVDAESAALGLGYIEPFRRRAMRRNTVFDQRLTLQLGRFQLTLPRLGRPADADADADVRPDTPDVTELHIDDLDFVRFDTDDTYTLNGRTIRLLGGNFENYPPVLGVPGGSCPPSYSDAVRYKFFGPPPEYLSREGLNLRVDDEARGNVEMPPCYDELGGGSAGVLADGAGNLAVCTANAGNLADCTGNVASDTASNTDGSNAGIFDDNAGNVASGGTGNLAENVSTNTSGGTGNIAGLDTGNIAGLDTGNIAGSGLADNVGIYSDSHTNGATSLNNNICASSSNTGMDTAAGFTSVTGLDTASALNNGNISTNTLKSNASGLNTGMNSAICYTVPPNDSNGNISGLNTGNEPVETLRSIIDNLPAIDSDVNANDTGIESGINTGIC